MSEEGKTPKEYEIVVNGERHEVSDETVTYDEVVQLAFPGPPNPDARYTVTFRGTRKPKDGSLKPGGSVTIKKQGAIFNVTQTVKS